MGKNSTRKKTEMTSDLGFMEGSLGVRKGAWDKEEDKLLKQCIETHGEGKWHIVPLKAGLNRCRKSCRLRWLNYLKPNIKRGKFEADEVDLMIRLHKLLGNRWSLIAGRLPGRTANAVKNYWNTHRKKRAIPFEEDKEAEIQQVTKANIIKPRPRCFPKNLDSSSREKTQVFKSNVLLGGDQNHDNNSAALQAALENAESRWWECLLNDTDQEEPPSFAGLSGESYSSLEAKADGTSCGGNQSFLSDFSFDVDVWNFLSAEN